MCNGVLIFLVISLLLRQYVVASEGDGETTHLQTMILTSATSSCSVEILRCFSDTIRNKTQQSQQCLLRQIIVKTAYVIVCCRYLATGSSFKTLGYSFRVSDVTVGRIVKETCQAIWDNLHTLHMPFPKENDVKSIVESFWKKWKFPNCVGCIDGKHVRIKKPRHSGSMFRNYKQFFSIILQAVAGPNYKFLAIHVGAYGKESDGGVFSHSSLSKKLEEGALGVGRHCALPGTNIMVPYVLLGDEGYPLKTYLMRPFPVSKLGPMQTVFNKCLSKTRQVVECAFGIMTSKWRLLQRSIEIENPDDVDIIVKCICLLHNIVIDKEGEESAATFSCQQTQSTKRYASVGENRGVSAA